MSKLTDEFNEAMVAKFRPLSDADQAGLNMAMAEHYGDKVPAKTDVIDEYMWAGYLKFLAGAGFVTLETPRAEVEAIKAEFMAGLHDSGSLPDESSIAQSPTDVPNEAHE